MGFTLLEVHFPNAEFNAPFAGRAVDDDEDTAPWALTDGAPLSRIAPVAAILALVGLVLLARYFRGGESQQTTLDEMEA